MKIARLVFPACFMAVLGCGTGPGSDTMQVPAGVAAGPAIDVLLDDWHQAASVADEARYFAHFAADAVFLGTDADERWTLEEFRSYAHPHFAAGRGWTYAPSDRHVALAAGGGLAWFDERLRSEKYGDLRGTGVARHDGDRWKLVQYSMVFTVPNDVAAQVVEVIRSGTVPR